MQAPRIAAPPSLAVLPDAAPPPTDTRAAAEPDPSTLIRTCANCGAAMDERKCKLVCTCGYFLSCSDYF